MSLFATVLELSASILLAYVAYGAIHWLMGTHEHRQKALSIWYDVVESAIIFAISWFLLPLGLAFANQIQETLYPSYQQYWQLPPVSSWSLDVVLQGPATKGLENASAVFSDIAKGAASNMATLANWMVITGLAVFLQTVSMAIGQVSGMLYAVGTGILITSWAIAYAAKLVEAMLGLYPIFALMLATGRRVLASFGAALIAFVAVASAALPVAATAVVVMMQENALTPIPSLISVSGITALLFGKVVDYIIKWSSFYAQLVVLYGMLSVVVGGASGALAYALGGIPHSIELF